MNKRILELAEQAGSTHKLNLGVYQFYTDELEKFAESIVEACLTEVVLCYGEGREIPIEGGGHYHSEDWDAALTQVITNIRHYLGVK